MGGLLEVDPREVLLGIALDESTVSKGSISEMKNKGDDVDLVEEFKRLRQTVEHDHDRRLRGIEINIRWLMILVGGEVLAIIGFALGTVAGA